MSVEGILNARNIAVGLKRALIDIFHPIGTHYDQHYGEPTPAELFGGTWVIDNDYAGRVVIGSGGSYTLGDIGGEESHLQTLGEMPSHTHTEVLSVSDIGPRPMGSGSIGSATFELSANAAEGRAAGNYIETWAAGGTSAFNIMQPYKVQNVWKRTA